MRPSTPVKSVTANPPASHGHSISISYAKALLNSASRLGLPIGTLLQEAGIPVPLLQTNGSRISPLQFAKLIRSVSRHSGEETLGMTYPRSKNGVFTLVAEQLLQCRNLGQILDRACGLYNMLSDGFSLSFERDYQPEPEPDPQSASKYGPESGSGFGFTNALPLSRFSLALTHPEHDPDHFLVEFLLLIWHRFPSWLIGERIPLYQVNFVNPAPPHPDEYRFLFPAPWKGGQKRNDLIFDRRSLDKPLLATPGSLRTHLARSPLDWVTRQAYHPAITDAIFEQLKQAPPEQLPKMQSVAKNLAMSTRTLRRKLHAEGTSYQQLKDEYRRDQAITLLQAPGLSLAEIGAQLGFDEASGFVRAFKHWTGVAPGAWRRQYKTRP